MGSGELLYVPRLEEAPHALSATAALARALRLQVMIAAPLALPPESAEVSALDRQLQHAQARASALRAELERAGASVAQTSILRFGAWSDLLDSLLDEREPELVLVEAPASALFGASGLRTRSAGAPAPVWVFTGDAHAPQGPIRCAFLPSEPPLRAIEVAAILARALEVGMDLVLLSARSDLATAEVQVQCASALTGIDHTLRAAGDLSGALMTVGLWVLGPRSRYASPPQPGPPPSRSNS